MSLYVLLLGLSEGCNRQREVAVSKERVFASDCTPFVVGACRGLAQHPPSS